eukprot:TRINITY_DN6868_c0_g1_i1.p1 TRINITY_DN6868_c0_g1~~TRINITY_DN6868_c0_g1_i1.p1  ORF type:complete len:330 (-),score=73.21 TRINITY_DN6868_c0_g1_i1:62-994(-)
MDALASFYESVEVPSDLAEQKSKIEAFVAQHVSTGKKIALVTSGGTIVPVELNMVRYLDNFSGGGRGASSTEYLLDRGYAVIFLYRKNTLQPYVRHCMLQGHNFFDYLTMSPSGEAVLSPDHAEPVSALVKKYHDTVKGGALLRVTFQSVGDYLSLLKVASIALNTAGPRALVFLAAAVSDYYIPLQQMSRHKIQSSEGPLKLNLEPVPKMLGILSSEWTPKAFITSFKLETDSALLEAKCKRSLASYGHQLVVGNLLASYRDWVVCYTPNAAHPVKIERQSEREVVRDIEEKLISNIVEWHEAFISSAK